MSRRTTARAMTLAAIRCLLSIVLLAAFAQLAMACPTCKDSVAGDPAAAGMVKGYFWSILFMMSMPFVILCGLGGYFYLEIRKAHRDGGARPAPLPSAQPLPADLTADWT